MRKRFLRLVLTAVAVTTAGIGGSCASRKKAPTLYLPSAGTEISIALRFPFHAVSGTEQSFSYVCEDAQAFLVSLDVGSAATPSWDYRFLVGLDGQLWGCAADPTQPCPDQHILKGLERPYRIAVEGIDVAPANYTSGAAHNVICRGVADSLIGMGQMDVMTIPTPSPQASPPPAQTTLTIMATVPMLRIGDMNGTFTTAGAEDAAVVAGDLTPSWIQTRTSSGGIAVFARFANAMTDPFLEFIPSKIGMFSRLSALRHSRIDARATAFLDSAGRPALLIVGGNFGGMPVDFVEIYRSGESSTTEVATGPGSFAGSAIVDLPGYQSGGATVRAVALIGGCGSNGGSYTFNATYTLFFPAAPNDLSGCLSSAMTGAPAFCRPGAGLAMGDGGHCGMPVGAEETPTGTKIFMGPGYQGPSSLIESTKGYVFDPLAKTYSGPLPIVGNPPYTGRDAVNLSSSLLAFFGGSDSGGQNSNRWGYFRRSDSAIVGVATSTLKTPRAGHRQDLLLDGRVVLVGGNGPVDPNTLEFFVPSGVTPTSGVFEYSGRLAAATPCLVGSETNCVRFATPRISMARAVIRGSSSWINGSVVYSGGAVAPRHGTELYVPAYNCIGSSAVHRATSAPIIEVDFCDRGRTGLLMNDPSSSQRLAH